MSNINKLSSESSWAELFQALSLHANKVVEFSGSNREHDSYDLPKIQRSCGSVADFISLTPAELIPALEAFLANVELPLGLDELDIVDRVKSYDIAMVRDVASNILVKANTEFSNAMVVTEIDDQTYKNELKELRDDIQSLREDIRASQQAHGNSKAPQKEKGERSLTSHKAELLERMRSGLTIGTGGIGGNIDAISALAELMYIELDSGIRLNAAMLTWYAKQLRDQAQYLAQTGLENTSQALRDLVDQITGRITKIVESIISIVNDAISSKGESKNELPDGTLSQYQFITKSFGREIICIDLGTSNLRISSTKRGYIFDEPSVIEYKAHSGRNLVISIGKLAKTHLGMATIDHYCVRPMRDGVIADFELVEAMVKKAFDSLYGRFQFARPQGIVTVPSSATSVERRAILQSIKSALRTNKVHLIEEPIAAALGAELPFDTLEGCFQATIGAGTSEVAVLCLGGIVYSRSVRIGGDRMDGAIVHYLGREKHLLINELAAEKIKKNVGKACSNANSIANVCSVRGRHLVTGDPHVVEVNSDDILQALTESVHEIVDAISIALESIPPELRAHIIESGLNLSGEGALLPGLDTLIAKTCKIPVRLTQHPHLVTLLGAHQVALNYSKLRTLLTPEV